MLENYDITMMRGDTLAYRIEVSFPQGVTPLIPDEIRMTCKRLSDSMTPLFALSIGNGITADGAGWDVRVPPEATAKATPGVYHYDVEFTFGDDVYTPLFGDLIIVQDVTMR